MGFNMGDFRDGLDNHPDNEIETEPGGYRVDDDDNLTEANLERSLYGKSENNMRPVMEGKPMGGQNFGKSSITPAADDKNNPSQNAGYTNAYFARTEPSDEHPENSNFKDKNQDGLPDYDKAQPDILMNGEHPKPEAPERGNGENDRPHKGGNYHEESANKKEPNIPGPDELPDQQKVGENPDDYPDDEEHIET